MVIFLRLCRDGLGSFTERLCATVDLYVSARLSWWYWHVSSGWSIPQYCLAVIWDQTLEKIIHAFNDDRLGWIEIAQPPECRPAYSILHIESFANEHRRSILPELCSLPKIFHLPQLSMLPVEVANVTFGEGAEWAKIVLGHYTTVTQDFLCTKKVRYNDSNDRSGALTMTGVVEGICIVCSMMIIMLHHGDKGFNEMICVCERRFFAHDSI